MFFWIIFSILLSGFKNFIKNLLFFLNHQQNIRKNKDNVSVIEEETNNLENMKEKQKHKI